MTAKNLSRKNSISQTLLLGISLLILSIGCGEDECPLPIDEEELVEISIADTATTIAENPINGFTLLTIDASINTKDAIVFSISSQAPDGSMIIEPSTGQISVLDSSKFDYEINTELTAIVTASSVDISASADVTITLTDIDETVDPPTPTDIWQQVGDDIVGETSGDHFGWSTSLSADGSILAVGGRDNDGNGDRSGHVRVFRNTGGIWSQIGDDIDGENEGDQSGWSISLSDDGSILAIGAKLNEGSGIYAGHVRVYQNIEDSWVQLGNDIDAESDNDLSGQSVSLSGDGSRVAIGGHFNKQVGTKRGHVRIFELVSGRWAQVGTDIDGEANFDESGWSVSMSQDGSIVAVGAIKNDDNGDQSGHVRVFKEISNAWIQIGNDIDGEAEDNQSGYAISLSNDGSIIAIGAPFNTSTTFHDGHVRVYRNIADDWVQIGSDIDGESPGDQSGFSISLSGNESIVAIGSYWNSDRTGHVRVFKNDSGTWKQLSEDIDGILQNESFGTSVSISSDGKTVASGAIFGLGTGYVRVYEVAE